MKSLRKKSRLLVEQILKENFLDANSTLASLVMEAEENREESVNASLGDEDLESGSEGEGEEQVNTDGIDEPTDGGPALGDSLDQSVEDVEDQSVGEGEMTEMSNDIVEINCEVNQKMISKLFDKISNLKTTLNAKDMDHDTYDYVELETKLSYYGNKLTLLQSEANPAIDQSKVEEKVKIIVAALDTLETEICGSDEDSEIKSTSELDEAEEGSEESANSEGEEENSEESSEEGEGEESEEEETSESESEEEVPEEEVNSSENA